MAEAPSEGMAMEIGFSQASRMRVMINGDMGRRDGRATVCRVLPLVLFCLYAGGSASEDSLCVSGVG